MKKNLLTMVILALLLVNIALTAVMMISVTSTNKKTAALIDNIATVMNLELTGGESEESGSATVTLADTEIYSIEDQMTIPLKEYTDENGKVVKSHMVCHFSLQVNKAHDDYKEMQPLIATNESVIKDKIRTIVASKTEEECKNDEEGLKAEILKAIQDLFGSDFIYGVVISDTVYG